MEEFVNALEAIITPSALWGALTPFVVIIGVLIIFNLSKYFIKKISKGAARGGKLSF